MMRIARALLALLALAGPARAQEQVDIPGYARLARLCDVDGDGVREVCVLLAQEGWDPGPGDVASRQDALVSVRAHGGRLSAEPPVALPSPVSGFSVLDLTGDGSPDLCLVTRAGVLMADRQGKVKGAPLSGPFLHEDHADLDLVLDADVDGDGHPDLCLPTETGMRYRLWREGLGSAEWPGVDVDVASMPLGGEGPSLFSRLAALGAPPRAAFVRALPLILDVDGDGRPDAVLPLARHLDRLEGIELHQGTLEGSPFAAKARAIELPLGAGDVLAGPQAMAFGDIDGDGRKELGILTNDLEDFGLRQTKRLRVFRFGSGYVPEERPVLDADTDSNLWEPTLLSLSDVDGDGKAEVVVTHAGGLRKTSFTVETWKPRVDGRFAHESQTLKIGKDEKIDRTLLLPPVDLDGDGKADFIVAGKRVIYVLGGRFDGGDIFTDPPRQIVRLQDADKVLAVLPDARAVGWERNPQDFAKGGRRPAPLYVVARLKTGKNRVLRVVPRSP